MKGEDQARHFADCDDGFYWGARSGGKAGKNINRASFALA